MHHFLFLPFSLLGPFVSLPVLYSLSLFSIALRCSLLTLSHSFSLLLACRFREYSPLHPKLFQHHARGYWFLPPISFLFSLSPSLPFSLPFSCSMFKRLHRHFLGYGSITDIMILKQNFSTYIHTMRLNHGNNKRNCQTTHPKAGRSERRRKGAEQKVSLLARSKMRFYYSATLIGKGWMTETKGLLVCLREDNKKCGNDCMKKKEKEVMVIKGRNGQRG